MACRQTNCLHLRGHLPDIIQSVQQIQAVVTDLDGTIVDNGQHLSAATLNAAADLAAAGIPLILATARTPSWVAGLTELTPHVRVAVCCGGAVGWSPGSGDMLWRDTIPSGTVRRIVDAVSRNVPDVAIAVYDGWRWRVTAAYAERGPQRKGVREVVVAGQLAGDAVCAVSICGTGETEGLPDLLADMMPPLTIETSASGVTDISAHGTDKARGVIRALDEVGINPADAIVFGDMPMDLPMFAVCGYAVAVGNAHPDLMAAATEVSACIHNDGFARTLGALGLARAYTLDGAGPGCCRGETAAL